MEQEETVYKYPKEFIESIFAYGSVFDNGNVFVTLPNWYEIVDREKGLVKHRSKFYLPQIVKYDMEEVNELGRKIVLNVYDEGHKEFATAYNMAIITINHLLNHAL